MYRALPEAGLWLRCRAHNVSPSLEKHFRLYEFSLAAITNDHKPSGLKQYQSIILFWRPEVKNQEVSRAGPIWRLQGEASYRFL